MAGLPGWPGPYRFVGEQGVWRLPAAKRLQTWFRKRVRHTVKHASKSVAAWPDIDSRVLARPVFVQNLADSGKRESSALDL